MITFRSFSANVNACPNPSIDCCSGGRMASLYTEAANRARLSRQVTAKLAKNKQARTYEKVRAAKRKKK
jgi:hypothetical protein